MLSKKLTAISITVIAMVGFLSSCGGSSDNSTKYIPVQFTDGGGWSFINDKGEKVGTQEWEFEPTVTRGNIFTARTDSGLTVYRWHGDEARPIDSLQNLVSVGILNDGLMPVTPAMKRIRIVDSDGDTEFVLEPIDGKEIRSCAAKFKENRLIVTTIDGKTGVIDNKGNVIVKPSYSDISNYNGGYALAVNYDFEGDGDNGPSYTILDIDGKATPVKGKFGYSENDCAFVPEFEADHTVSVAGLPDTTSADTYTPTTVVISADGKVKSSSKDVTTTTIANGSKIIYNYSNNGTTTTWLNPEGKEIMKVSGDETLNGSVNYVLKSSEKESILYSDNGTELNKFAGLYYMIVPGGKFGPVLNKYEDDKVKYTLLMPDGKPIDGLNIYGVGTSDYIDLSSESEEISCNDIVTSAYIDITAATTKLVNMVKMNSVQGKQYYYIGQSVAEILSGENARFYTGGDRTISIPTDSTGLLGSGAGFWITGTAKASANIVAPIYQQYFEVHHYDYWGNAWGWNRKRQTGVKFNPAAKVTSFDLQLHTNHASGDRLRESVGRHLKKEGYTLVATGSNYDEYNNGSSTIIIYGTRESRGIGAVIGNKVEAIKDSDKASLAASIY